MTELNNKINAILEEKRQKLIPNNIKKNVTIFGITGTLEGGGTVEGAKIFSSVEEMQNDTDKKAGDCAVVYSKVIGGIKADTEFSNCVFPSQVVLSEAMTDRVDLMFRAVDESVMFDGFGMIDSNMFSLDCYTESDMIRVMYESSDGITYTRTRGEENVDFGTMIHYDGGAFDNRIGEFMKAEVKAFKGFYVCNEKTDNTRMQFISKEAIQVDMANKTGILDTTKKFPEVYSYTEIQDIRSTMYRAGLKNTGGYLGTDNEVYIVADRQSSYGVGLSGYVFNAQGELEALFSSGKTTEVELYKLDIPNKTYTLIKTIPTVKYNIKNQNNVVMEFDCIPTSELNMKSIGTGFNGTNASANATYAGNFNGEYSYFVMIDETNESYRYLEYDKEQEVE